MGNQVIHATDDRIFAHFKVIEDLQDRFNQLFTAEIWFSYVEEDEVLLLFTDGEIERRIGNQKLQLILTLVIGWTVTGEVVETPRAGQGCQGLGVKETLSLIQA